MKKTFLATWRMFLCMVFASALLSSMVSCDSENGEIVTVTPEISVPNGYKNYFIEDLYFTRTAGEVKVTFQINVDWHLNIVAENGGPVSWCKVDLASGDAGMHKVMVRVDENKTYEVRVAKIQLMANKSKVAEILVSQEEASKYKGIDLGLSVKWAECNVGAEVPEVLGGYYAWGETEEKADYTWANYKWCNGTYNSLNKYCYQSSYGTVDDKTILDMEDDVAFVMWGTGWRMPTRVEAQELCNKCSWELTSVNGVKGYRVTGPNGNSIFFPREEKGFSCWTSTLCNETSSCVLTFGISSIIDQGRRPFYDCHTSRKYGNNVRPVTDY